LGVTYVRLVLKPLRIAAGFTQAQLASELGVEQATISRWESGETMPSVAKLIKLTTILKCDINDLFGADATKTA